MSRQNIRVALYEQTCNSEWDIDKFFALIEDVKKEAGEYAHTLRIETSTDSYAYNDGPDYAKLTISYRRPETDAEQTFREQEEARQKLSYLQYQRAEYERLKKQFEGK